MRVISMGSLIRQLDANVGPSDPFVQLIHEADRLSREGYLDEADLKIIEAMNLLDTYHESSKAFIMVVIEAWLFGTDGSDDAAGLADLPVAGNA